MFARPTSSLCTITYYFKLSGTMPTSSRLLRILNFHRMDDSKTIFVAGRPPVQNSPAS